MTEAQYNLLKKFPINKSYLSHKQLDDMTGNKLEYDLLVDKCNELFSSNLIEGFLPNEGLKITEIGIDALLQYEETIKKEDSIQNLKLEQLVLDVNKLRQVLKIIQ